MGNDASGPSDAAMPDYQHHIFISYRRMDEDWIRWTQENFVRPLCSLLRPALGNVDVFVDSRIETGVSWPARLAQAHARSRIMIPILCQSYFQSEWCRLELALMCHRENQLGFRTNDNEGVLIVPVILQDGKHFPLEVQEMQGEDIKDFANPCMRFNSPKQEEFTEHLRLWCHRIEEALGHVPPFDPAWESFARDQFKTQFQINAGQLKTVPPLSLPLRGTNPHRP